VAVAVETKLLSGKVLATTSRKARTLALTRRRELWSVQISTGETGTRYRGLSPRVCALCALLHRRSGPPCAEETRAGCRNMRTELRLLDHLVGAMAISVGGTSMPSALGVRSFRFAV
jgi:hypothetical protein